MVAVFGALTVVMVEICHSRLMIKNVAFFRAMSQIHHWSSEGETVGNIVTLFNELSQGTVVVSLLSHWVS